MGTQRVLTTVSAHGAEGGPRPDIVRDGEADEARGQRLVVHAEGGGLLGAQEEGHEARGRLGVLRLGGGQPLVAPLQQR